MKKIVLTGGGTAGHVTPNLALIPQLQAAGYEIYYIGSKEGMEKELVQACQIPYYGIAAGKLRRYLDIKNITDIFKVAKGVTDAVKVLKKIKPNVIFSKGGFVAVPVALAGKLLGIPVVIHESDITPGLANKIAMPFAKKICITFPETAEFVSKSKLVYTGTPIRKEILTGDKNKGLQLCGFTKKLPVVLLMGGSQGSLKLNQALRDALPQLLKQFQLIHLCGKGNLDDSLLSLEGYKQFEYINEDLKHIYAATDVIISRAGANAINEFLALKIPSLLIPLSAGSRGDQILNANSFQKQKFSHVLKEEDLSAESLLESLQYVYEKRGDFHDAMAKSKGLDGVKEVINILQEF